MDSCDGVPAWWHIDRIFFALFKLAMPRVSALCAYRKSIFVLPALAFPIFLIQEKVQFYIGFSFREHMGPFLSFAALKPLLLISLGRQT